MGGGVGRHGKRGEGERRYEEGESEERERKI